MMKINKMLTPYNLKKTNDPGRIKYIVIHYVGALGGARANCEYYASKYIGASAHYYVDFDGSIWQSVEDSDTAWHCGGKKYPKTTGGTLHGVCTNANSIGIEMCVRKGDTKVLGAEDKDWYFEDVTVEAAAELARYLMNKYEVPASNVIRHYDVTGKICPNPYVYNTGKHTWKEFKDLVNDKVSPKGEEKEDEEREIWDFLKDVGLNDYATAAAMAHFYAESGLKADNLQNTFNIRLGMTDEAYTAAVDNGSYTNFVHDGAGYGLAQWTYWSRKQKLLEYAKSNGKSIGDRRMQLEFFQREIQGYKSVMKILESASSVLEASNAILHEYERPADQSEAVEKRRTEYGEKYYEKYAKENAEDKTEKITLPCIVKVSIQDLRIRTGPGTNYEYTGRYTGVGAFTIVEIKEGEGSKKGWGKLLSGAGWISLDYVTSL